MLQSIHTRATHNLSAAATFARNYRTRTEDGALLMHLLGGLSTAVAFVLFLQGSQWTIVPILALLATAVIGYGIATTVAVAGIVAFVPIVLVAAAALVFVPVVAIPDLGLSIAVGITALVVLFLIGLYTVGLGVAGGALFAALTGKGTSGDSGLLLVVFVVLTTLHAAREVVAHSSLPAAARYGGVPLVFLPAITVYALVYEAISGVMAGLPVVEAPTELTALHVGVAVVFLAVYVAMAAGVHERSKRLYVALLNASQPASSTLLTATEDYNEY